MAQEIHFLLNNRQVTTLQPPGTLVLDFLRRSERLVGTKEGCKEGDCGACVVLIGELFGKSVEYKPITSCLMPIGELQGKQLVTIEGLNLKHLSPVQKAIVDEGGSQCGFCTPGIVVSLTGYLMTAPRHEGVRAGSSANIDDDGIKYALGGNLCRCTGYASLKRAGKKLIRQFGNGSKNGRQISPQNNIRNLVEKKAIPDYFIDIPQSLANLPKRESRNGKKRIDYFVAGGTDIYVQEGELLPDAQVDVLNLHPEMKGISLKGEKFHIGALTTFEEFADNREIQKIIPNIKEYMHLNASWQIRNRATLGGNIVNASPIGDMTALLLALESDLILQKGNRKRTVPMKRFFKGYKIMDKKRDEILTEIIFPKPKANTKIHFEKVSKRKTLDIASVNSAIKIFCNNGVIEEVEMSMGGVAPIPLFMIKTCRFLEGKEIIKETVLEAIQIAIGEISPISDIRGSAEYKKLLVRQFIIAHFTKLFPKKITVQDFYETH